MRSLMSIMKVILKVPAAFLAPFILCFFFLLYNIIADIIVSNSLNTYFTLAGQILGVFLIYIYALPIYLLIGIPISLIIERVNKGVRWINYSLGGMAGGLFLYFMNSNLQDLDGTFFLMAAAGLSYYFSLVFLEKLVQILRNKED